jgi:hypothetical protein
MSISFAILSQIYVLLQLLPKKITPKCSQLMKVFSDLGVVGSKITCLSYEKGLNLQQERSFHEKGSFILNVVLPAFPAFLQG